MVVNALSAEAAGRCFRAWRLMARLPGGKKDGQLARHMARFRWMEGVGDSPPLGNVPPSDMQGGGGREQVQGEGPCWRGKLCLSSDAGRACRTACLPCSLTADVSLLWASGRQVDPAMPALPQGAGDDWSGSQLLFLSTCWVAGTVLRGLPRWP